MNTHVKLLGVIRYLNFMLKKTDNTRNASIQTQVIILKNLVIHINVQKLDKMLDTRTILYNTNQFASLKTETFSCSQILHLPTCWLW